MDLFDIVAARVGGSGGDAPQKQSDWAQNDSSKKDYIKNRTHWKEEIERDYTELPNIEPDQTTGFVEYGKRIGLEIGKEYTLEAHLKDGTIQTTQAVAIEMPEDEIGIAGIPCIMVGNTCQIVDGIVFDLVAETLIAGDNCYYQFNSRVVDYVEKGIIKNLPSVETVIHKIPDEFIEFPEFPEIPEIPEVDQEYWPKSSKAQSGKAVKQAIEEYDESLIVDNENVRDNSLDGTKLRDSSLPAEKIEPGSIKGYQIARGLPYSLLESAKKGTQIDVSEKVAYVSVYNSSSLSTSYFEKVIITGTILSELRGKQYLGIYLYNQPSDNHCIYRLPIDTTDYDSVNFIIEIDKLSLPTGVGMVKDNYIKVEGCVFTQPGRYTNDVIILLEDVVPYIPFNVGQSSYHWTFCLKGELQGEMGYFLPGTSISMYLDKAERG